MPAEVWSSRSAAAYAALVERFWDRRRGLFRVSTGWRGRLPDPWHYWWQAHALDCAVAAADRPLAEQLVAGIVRRNGGRVENDYYDDMAWLGLALDRARSALDLPVEPLVDRLYTELRAGWHSEGGVRWRRDDSYRNAPASAPTALLAIRRGDLPYARRIVDWLDATLITAEHRVLDGVHARPGAVPHREWYSYNQGTAAAAHALLGDPARAEAIALAALPLGDEGNGDRALFKGIWARYAAEVAGLAGSARLRSELESAASAAWASRSPAGLFGPSWASPPAGPVDLSAHLSGVLALSALSGT